MNVEPTAAIVEDIADTMERYAKEMRHIAGTIRETGDLSRASEAMSAFQNMIGNCRLDLLVVRPIREIQRETDQRAEPSPSGTLAARCNYWKDRCDHDTY